MLVICENSTYGNIDTAVIATCSYTIDAKSAASASHVFVNIALLQQSAVGISFGHEMGAQLFVPKTGMHSIQLQF